jgi:hypothetical protein
LSSRKRDTAWGKKSALYRTSSLGKGELARVKRIISSKIIYFIWRDLEQAKIVGSVKTTVFFLPLKRLS